MGPENKGTERTDPETPSVETQCWCSVVLLWRQGAGVVARGGGRGTDEELSPDLAGRPGSVSTDRRGHNALNQ